MQKIIFILSILFLSSSIYAAKSKEIEVNRTAYKADQYTYYIIAAQKMSNTYVVSLKRVGASAIMFFKAQVNCSPRAFKALGSSSKSADVIQANYSNSWYTPTIGSIEVDVITMICR